MVEPAITVKNLSKQYVLGGEVDPQKTFREMLTGLAKEPIRRLRKLRGSSRQQKTFWALKDISFEVQPGEVLGIIGRNGAGKSTLLKILSRITAPTTGEIQYRGRLASLLEVGTGFHPELSGRENIFINGAILGMSRAEIIHKFDEIVDFAGIEQFLDTPVKRYSSGMYVRLAFAVAAHLDPDILVVDEVLAVGDIRFQEKCIGKMQEVAGYGRTVLFVSHNMGMISKLCQRGIVLDTGNCVFDGSISESIQGYYQQISNNNRIPTRELFGELKTKVLFKTITINCEVDKEKWIISPEDKIAIEVGGISEENVSEFRITVSIRKNGELLVSLHDSQQYYFLQRGEFVSQVVLPAFFLSPGNYQVEIGGYSSSGTWVWVRNIADFNIVNKWFQEYDTNANMGLINLPVAGSHN